MLNWKYFEKVWKYLRQYELRIYFLIFSLSGFWVWNFEMFSWFSHLWFGLRIFSKTFLHFSTSHLKLRNFFTQVLLELNKKIFEIFSNPVDLNWTLKIFLKFFQPCSIEVGLWEVFENFSNLYWLSLNFVFSLNMYTHMIELAYSCWTVLTFTNPIVLYLVDIPPSQF